MQLPLLTFTTLVQRMSATLQGSAQALIDVSVGSVLRAVLEASASVALWLQWLILQVLSMTRAATSAAGDLDSWMADFGLSRLPASAATGSVTFARYTPGLAASIPVGTLVRTADGSQSFAVIASPGTPGWDGTGAYSLMPTDASISVPVQAVLAGSQGNVQAGAIALLASALPGVDTVTNPLALGGGLDGETDSALRTRFQAYINSRSLATSGAVGFAVASVRQGLRWAVLENVDGTGAYAPGSFRVTVDDGTGAPSAALLAVVQAAVDAVRPIGSMCSVLAPVQIGVTVNLTVEIAASASRSAISAEIVASIGGWIAGLPIGGTLALSRMIALSHSADPGVLSVSNVEINGQAADLILPPNGVAIDRGVLVS